MMWYLGDRKKIESVLDEKKYEQKMNEKYNDLDSKIKSIKSSVNSLDSFLYYMEVYKKCEKYVESKKISSQSQRIPDLDTLVKRYIKGEINDSYLR